MKSHSGFVAAGVLAAALALTGPVWAATGGAAPGGAMAEANVAAAGGEVPSIRPMTDGEKQAAGCVISATATMAATYAAGPSEVIMLVVGGLIVPSSSEVLFISLMSTMASMACGAGAAITPAVLWVANQAGSAGQQAAAVSGTLGSGLAHLGSGVTRAFADLTAGREAQ